MARNFIQYFQPTDIVKGKEKVQFLYNTGYPIQPIIAINLKYPSTWSLNYFVFLVYTENLNAYSDLIEKVVLKQTLTGVN